MLLAFRASLPPLAALQAGAPLPTRLQVARWGENANSQGKRIVVNDTTARVLPLVNRTLGFDTVALDFEHNTVKGSPEWRESAEPRKVAAHGTPRVVPGEGLFIEEIRWTPEGEASVRGGHHPDLSPAVKTNERGEVVLMHSTALCRQGSIEDLRLFAAGLDAETLALCSAALAPISHPIPTTMNERLILLRLLGLAENATADQIAAATTTLSATLAQLAGLQQALASLGQLTTLSATVKSQGEQIATFTAKLEKAERDAITAQALAEGKLITAAVAALPLEQFTAVVKELPAGVVPVEKRTPDQVSTFSANVGRGEADAAGEAVRAQLGISKEEWAKSA